MNLPRPFGVVAEPRLCPFDSYAHGRSDATSGAHGRTLFVADCFGSAAPFVAVVLGEPRAAVGGGLGRFVRAGWQPTLSAGDSTRAPSDGRATAAGDSGSVRSAPKLRG